MLVICEECGAKHQIDASKVKDTDVVTQCKFCRNEIVISKSEEILSNTDNLDEQILENILNVKEAESETEASLLHTADTLVEEIATEPQKRRRSFLGLRGKMLVLFFIVPIILIGSASVLYFANLKSLADIIGNESRELVTDIAENFVSEKALAVARQVHLYLKTHPEFTVDDFRNTPEFMKIAVQKVGKTGYTVINSAPTAGSPWIIRAHPQDELIGKDIMVDFKTNLKQTALNILINKYNQALKKGGLTTGYYLFFDNREKFMALAPIKGTHLWVSAATYVDEFTVPVSKLENRVDVLLSTTMRIILTILVITAVLISTVVILYATRLTNNIKALTEAANQIGFGDIDYNIQVNTKDELGDLAKAIGRIQSSIHISINRFRRKKR